MFYYILRVFVSLCSVIEKSFSESLRSKIQTPPLAPPLEGRGAAARRDTEVPDPSVSCHPSVSRKIFLCVFVSLCSINKKKILCVPLNKKRIPGASHDGLGMVL